MINEKLLIKKAARGSEAAFEDLINLYKNYVFAIILNFIKDHNEVENLAQEVFLQVYLSLPSYKEDNFKGWIGRIATNKSIDWIRKKRAKYKEEVLDREDLLDKIDFSQNKTPEDLVLEKEKKEEISKLCSSMPKIYEEAIINFYMEGKSYEEMALEEGVSVKTIASRLYRAKNILREKWREENETL